MEDRNESLQSGSSSLSIKDLFFKYIRFLPWIVLSVAICLLAAFLYLRYATPIYTASGNMMIKSDKVASARPDKVEDIIFGGANRSQNLQSEIEVLKSRPLMKRVVDRLNLQFTYYAVGKIKNRNLYNESPFEIQAFELRDSTRSFNLKIDFTASDKFSVDKSERKFDYGEIFANQHGVFRLNKVRNGNGQGQYLVNWKPSYSAAASLIQKLNVQLKTPGTGILAISQEGTNPSLAADVVNTLIVQYDSMTIEQNNISADQMLGFIDLRLEILSRELDTVQRKKLDFQLQENLIDVDRQLTAYFENVDQTQGLLNAEEAKVFNMNLLAAYLQEKQNEFTVVPSSFGIDDMTLTELVGLYNKAQLERQSYIDALIPPSNPSVRQVEGQIEKLRQNILENLKNLVGASMAAISKINKTNIEADAKLKSLPEKIKDFVEISRQVDTKLELFKILQQKREEAAISRASTISNSKLINEANVNPTPIKPNSRMIQLMAILAGIAIPIGIIFIAELLNDKITTRHDVERVTSAPIIGEIGHSYSEYVLVVNRTSRSMVAEQFRTIRSNLDYVLTKAERFVILVTSSFSGEGKSFVSTNMGAVLALAGKKSIILEFDIRKPKVLSGLKMGKHKGISNYLAGNAALDELILPVPGQENLYVLPCGPVPPNPSELLLDMKVATMFEQLKEDFDVIIIDTAPVGMVSDAMTLGKFADCTLYLTRQGHTYKKQISLVDEIYREKKLPRVSVIINDVRLKPGYGYYGYGRYGYGYGYGYGEKSSYYEEEKAPRKGIIRRIFNSLNPFRWFRK